MIESPTVSVIIVSYNTREMTLDCLRTLQSQLDQPPTEIWLVDNGSTDGSADAVAVQFPRVRLIRNAANRGFGAANNQAIREATGEFVLLLNTDAFPKPGAVGAMVDLLRRRKDVAVVGPRLLNRDGSLQRSCYRFPSPGRALCEHSLLTSAFPNNPITGDYRGWNHDCERNVDFVGGACMIVRRAAIEQVGLFDETFFFYAEETDWCRRFHHAGWRVAFTPDAEVTHIGGASGVAQSDRVFEEFHRARERLIRKHHGTVGLFAFRFFEAIGALLRFLVFGAIRIVSPGRREKCTHLMGKWRRILWWTLGRRGAGLRDAVSKSMA